MSVLNQDIKKVFWQQGTCSRLYCYIIDQEFDNYKPEEERACDPLCGGIMQKGHQCGMLWGASLGIGIEAAKREENKAAAEKLAINASAAMLESFLKQSGTLDCKVITGTNWSNPFSFAVYVIFKTRRCFNLAADWAAAAVESSKTALESTTEESEQDLVNCASLAIEKMGGSREEQIMAAGFAGGLGLSGHGCGALAASAWLRSLRWGLQNPGKSMLINPEAKRQLKPFLKETGKEFRCDKICGRKFQSAEEHSTFIKEGGCEKIINILAKQEES